MKYIFFFTLISSFCTAQTSKEIINKLGPSPVFYIDSLKVDLSTLPKFERNTLGLVTIYTPNESIELFGEEMIDGAIFMETKSFCKKRFQNYFKKKSIDYKNIIDNEIDQDIQYILNGKILNINYEGDLAKINDEIFINLRILTSDELFKIYNISQKKFGVLIESEVPKNLYRGKERFN